MSDQELEALWKQLGDVPCDDNGMLLEQWREWQSGTDRELIWHWFDRSHSAGVVALMFPVEVGGHQPQDG
jgi:hypothetical protein